MTATQTTMKDEWLRKLNAVGFTPPDGDASAAFTHSLRRGVAAFLRRVMTCAPPAWDETTVRTYGVWLETARRLGDRQAAMYLETKLMTALNHHRAAIRETACLELGAAQHPAAQTALLERLSDHAWWVRERASKALAGAAAAAADVRAALTARLNHDAPETRAAAAAALAAAAVHHPDARTAALTALQDTAWEVRAAACEALQTSVEHRDVRTALIQRLDDEPRVARKACEALRPLAGQDAAIRTVLVAQLENIHPDVRAAACEALTDAADQNADVRMKLLNRLSDESPKVRREACLALKKNAARPTVWKALVNLLGDQDYSVRYAAGAALSVAGEAATTPEHPFIKTLIRELQNGNYIVRKTVCEVFTEIAGRHPAVQTALMERLDDGNPEVRQAACRALTTTAATDAAVRTAVLTRLDDKATKVCVAACSALKRTQLPPVNDEWETTAARALTHRLREVRLAAIRAAAPGLWHQTIDALADRSWGRVPPKDRARLVSRLGMCVADHERTPAAAARAAAGALMLMATDTTPERWLTRIAIKEIQRTASCVTGAFLTRALGAPVPTRVADARQRLTGAPLQPATKRRIPHAPSMNM